MNETIAILVVVAITAYLSYSMRRDEEAHRKNQEHKQRLLSEQSARRERESQETRERADRLSESLYREFGQDNSHGQRNHKIMTLGRISRVNTLPVMKESVDGKRYLHHEPSIPQVRPRVSYNQHDPTEKLWIASERYWRNRLRHCINERSFIEGVHTLVHTRGIYEKRDFSDDGLGYKVRIELGEGLVIEIAGDDYLIPWEEVTMVQAERS